MFPCRLEGGDARPDQNACARGRPYGISVNAVSPGAAGSQAEERVFGECLEEYNRWMLENQSLKTRIQSLLSLTSCISSSRWHPA